ncbi:MAG: AAA family ATPase [Acidimicrobiia bacterium]
MTGTAAGTATILFTDLVGSTELRSALGDTAADDVRRSHEHLLTGAVEEHAGIVVKSLGDGILASFAGATDAVAAAVAIQQKTEAANRRVEDNRRIQVRVGCSAGDVAWEEGDCHGTPVVVASRLCDRAAGGQILCDDLVRGLARGRSGASFRIVGEVELKGISEPVVVYDVPWSPVAAGAAPLPAPLLPIPDELPFAGRDEQRRALLEQWKSAQTDGRTVALVSGEPGVGKTRLTAELARAAHDEGAWVLAGRCDESIAAPYTPWLEILRHAVAHAPIELLTGHVERHGGVITRLVPEIARRIDDVPIIRELDPDSERLALFDAVVDMVGSLAADAPAFVVIDDAHWADTASLDLLRRVVRQLPTTARVFIVVTYRDTDVDRSHPLAAVIGDLHREPRVERLSLRGMDERDVEALLTAAGGTSLDDEGTTFAHTLAVETEGNPFFIREILSHLIESGLLVHRDGRWQGTVQVGEVGIPEGIRDVVGRRLTRLSDAANETLRAAAVAGREFDVAVVSMVTDQSEDSTLAQVEEALRARLVDEVPHRPGRMSFSHALVRSTLLEELSTTRRVRLHRRIGEALEQDPDTAAAELAYHFAEAAATGVTDRAVFHAMRAAIEAREGVAYEEAVRFYNLALEALDAGDDDPRLRAEILAERSYVHAIRADQEQSHRDALAIVEIARALDDPVLLCKAGIAYMGLFTHWVQPGDPVAVDLMREGLAGLPPDEVEVRADVLSVLASALVVVPGDEALELAQEADRLVLDVDDTQTKQRALLALGWALRSRGRSQDVRATAQRGMEAARAERNSPFEMAMVYLHAVGLLGEGQLDEAEVEFARGAELPTALRDWLIPVVKATRAGVIGHFDEAIVFSDQAHEHGHALGGTNDTIWVGQRLAIARWRGNLDEALEWMQRSMDTAFPLLWYGATIRAELGDLDGARRASDTYEHDIGPLVPQVITDVSLDPRAETCAALHDTELAARLREAITPFRGQFLGSDTFMHGAAEHALGLVALAEESHDEAVELLEHAVGVAENLGLHVLGARHRVDLARALLARGGAGDGDRAAGLLREAADAAGTLGMRVTEQAALALLG